MNLARMAYNNLTRKQQRVWRLIMQECRSEYETADILGITRDAVHDRINKAKRRYKRFVLENKNEYSITI